MRGIYGKSAESNFEVKDTIGIPHPYTITPRHVGEASDNWGGMLGQDAIRAAESKGAKCGMKGCLLSYDAHEEALLVYCYAEMSQDSKTVPELHNYLLSIKDEATNNDYAGFAFIKKY